MIVTNKLKIQAVAMWLREFAGYRESIEKHRRPNGDDKITYVGKDGSRIHEDENPIAKLAATFSRVIEQNGETALVAAAFLEEFAESMQDEKTDGNSDSPTS